MELEEGKQKFIEAWGKLGANWGVCRTMAQIHALLLISCKPLSTDEIMDHLKISRGNAHKNIQSLLDWGIVHKELLTGVRKEHFYAEKDMWKVLKHILIERKKRELEPMIEALAQVDCIDGNCEESDEFWKMVRDLSHFSKKTNSALETFIAADSNGVLGRVFNVF